MNYFIETTLFDYLFSYLLIQFSDEDSIHVAITKNNKYCRRITYEITNIKGRITLWYNGIIEEQILDQNHNILFYLHYQFKSYRHFLEMFKEYQYALLKHYKSKKYQIGILSHDGLSSSSFVSMIKEILKYEENTFIITPLGLDDLSLPLDILYLAPQLKLKHPVLLSQVSIPIYDIDPLIYGSKDAQKMISIIKRDINNL